MTHLKKQALRTAAATFACALALAGCGGGGGSDSGSAATAPPSSTGAAVPMAASQSVAGLIAWASTLAPDDTATPLATDSFTPPVDDSAQPMSV